MKADTFIADLKLVYKELKRTIKNAQYYYQILADKQHTPAPKIEVGDHIFILAKFVNSTQPSKKLSERYLGPFEILDRLGTHSYLIKLPNHLRTIHSVFYISQIKLASYSDIPNYVNPFSTTSNLK